MQKKIMVLVTALLPGGLTQLFSPVAADEVQVVGVTDGDTVKVLTKKKQVEKVRLAEIDTPEKKQPWGKKAKQALSDMVFKKIVRIERLNKDRYGRTIGRLYIDGKSINRAMVRQGHAWVYRRYLKDRSLLDDEAYARQNRLELWQLPQSQRIAPWEWRKRNRKR